MSVILSLFIALSPLWTFNLKPIHIEPKIQHKLHLTPSLDDRYIVFTFKQTKDLLLFRDWSIGGAKKLDICLD